MQGVYNRPVWVGYADLIDFSDVLHVLYFPFDYVYPDPSISKPFFFEA